MMKNRITFILLCSILYGSSSFGASGKRGLSFLSLGNGARSIGMGEAQTALAESSNAIYWNPAGLALTSYPEMSLTHSKLFEDSAQQYAALAFPLKKGERGSIGVSATRFSISEIESRDAQSTLLDTKLEQENLNLQASYGFRVGGGTGRYDRDGFYFGAGAKRISGKLAGVSASVFGFDVGAQYRPGDGMVDAVGEWARRMSLGVAGLNFGKGPTFDKEETPLPQTTRFGLAYTHFLWGDAITLASDYEVAKNGENRIMAGAEFWLKNILALRAGYVEGQDVGDEVRFGAGFRFQTLQLDYALARFGEALGNTHRLTLTFRFGDGAVKATTGLKADLVNFYRSEAQEQLAAGSYHEAIINANNVLEVDPLNSQALQILFEAGEKMKNPAPLPEPKSDLMFPVQPALQEQKPEVIEQPASELKPTDQQDPVEDPQP